MTTSLCGRSAALLVLFSAVANAQVHYHPDGGPWKQRARKGPDAVVDGWYYNLGETGIRVQLMEDTLHHLLVKHVFEGSPAHGRVKVGDVITGAGGRPFKTEHWNGYGMKVFGPEGPLLEFSKALSAAQSPKGKSKLLISLKRDGTSKKVSLKVGQKYGAYAKKFPEGCPKSEKIVRDLLVYLTDQQRDDGSWGNPVHDTYAPLALLANGKKHRKAVEKNVRFHARTTHAQDESSLINWRYTTAAIVMSEYYLATQESWVVPELQEVYDFLISTQYMSLSQVSPRVKESHPDAFPRNPLQQNGGWGHNPGFEGYGPIAMITGLGALSFALMSRCGIEVDRERHDAAYAFLERASGDNGYVWYGDSAGGGPNDWADMGRTGAAGIANFLSPYQRGTYNRRALEHARVIGEHPESFPDTHGSPILGMGYAALAAHCDGKSFRRLMDANEWWFVLSQCHDGTFYYQPNRDNAGYGADSRLSASAVTAFIFSMPKRTLILTGK